MGEDQTIWQRVHDLLSTYAAGEIQASRIEGEDQSHWEEEKSCDEGEEQEELNENMNVIYLKSKVNQNYC